MLEMTSYKSAFQRSQSKVWWGSMPERSIPYYDYSSLPILTSTNIPLIVQPISSVTPPPPLIKDTNLWLSHRRDSPGSLKSHDSGFSDSGVSGNGGNNNINTSNLSQSLSPITIPPSPDKLTPKKSVNNQINSYILQNQRSPSINYSTCSSNSDNQSTPPTVIRRKLKNTSLTDYSSYNLAHRISLSAPNSPTNTNNTSTILPPTFTVLPMNNFDNSSEFSSNLINKINSLNYSSISPITSPKIISNSIDLNNLDCNKCNKDRSIRRRRKSLPERSLLKKINRKLIDDNSDNEEQQQQQQQQYCPLDRLTSDSTTDDCQQKFVIDNIDTPKSILKFNKDYKNETIVLGIDDNYYPSITSTPKKSVNIRLSKNLSTIIVNDPSPPDGGGIDHIELTPTLNWETCTYIEYTNPALNGHSGSVQFWLDEIRSTYSHEVLSTLQTKSVALEASRNFKLNSITATKLIRQLQSKAIGLQNQFEKIEKNLIDHLDNNYYYYNTDERIEFSNITNQLLSLTLPDFLDRLKSKIIFNPDNDIERMKYQNNLISIIDMSMDLRQSIKSNYQLDNLDFDVFREDFQLLKRYLLITIRMIFEKLIRIIIERCEYSSNFGGDGGVMITQEQSDLLLKSNLNMIIMLSNMNYNGFASLTDAFLMNDTIKMLLLICLDSKQSSIRTLALRALASVCSSPEAIRQFDNSDGIEIIKDILLINKTMRRSDRRQRCKSMTPITRSTYELREAVSVLAQITAPWHEKRLIELIIISLKNYMEIVIESLTHLIEKTTCLQTLLLCVAVLNNLSNMEKSAIYSIMSNNSILILKKSICSRSDPNDISIFLYEQICAMLLNMAVNKKCHNHLSNKQIIQFIVSIFESQFYRKFTVKSELDAQRKTIKNCLFIFTHLLQESIVGPEILEQNVIPIFSNFEHRLASNRDNYEYFNDIKVINKKLNDSVNGGVSISNVKRDDKSMEGNRKLSNFPGDCLESYV